MPRKVIQIICALSDAPGNAGRERLFALCDDGAIFYLPVMHANHGIRKWEELPPVPQPRAKEDVWDKLEARNEK